MIYFLFLLQTILYMFLYFLLLDKLLTSPFRNKPFMLDKMSYWYNKKNFHLCDKFWSVSYNAILSSINLIHIFLKSDLYILTYDITVKYLKINCFLLTAGHALDKLPDVAPLSQEHLATMMKTAFNLGLYSTLEVNHPICDTLTLLNSLSGY